MALTAPSLALLLHAGQTEYARPQVVVVDMVTGKAQTWEPCENRSLARFGGSSPAMITAYWGTPETHCIEVDKLSTVTVNANPQVRRDALSGL